MKALSSPLPVSLAVLSVVLLVTSCSLFDGGSARRQALAQDILQHKRISLANFHVSGRRDTATALDNIRQTARGGKARRSYYGNAPGGYTRLDNRMLAGLKKLADQGYRMRLTEVAGGSHSRKSRHYAGLAFDVDYINGIKVGYGNPYYRKFMKRCRRLGATEVLGPGDRGHNTHIHVAWPRK